MQCLPALLLGLTLTTGQLAPPTDVDKVEENDVLLPLNIDPSAKDKIKSILLYMSDNKGKTWELHSKYKSTDKEMRFVAITPGEYWFALQILFSDGKLIPAKTEDLQVARKIQIGKKEAPILPPSASKEDTDKLNEELEKLREIVAKLKADPPTAVQPLIPADVTEVNNRGVTLPLLLDPGSEKLFKEIKLYYSEDLGKTWTVAEKYKPIKQDMEFKATHDGLYWFTLQFENKNGSFFPKEKSKFQPFQKIFVNTGQALANAGNLRQEVADLRKTVDALLKKVSQLEKGK